MIYHDTENDIYLCVGLETLIYDPSLKVTRDCYFVKIYDPKQEKVISEGTVDKGELDKNIPKFQVPSDNMMAKLLLMGLE
jgi:hypothetical protein